MPDDTFPAESLRRRIILCCTFTMLAVFASAMFALRVDRNSSSAFAFLS